MFRQVYECYFLCSMKLYNYDQQSFCLLCSMCSRTAGAVLHKVEVCATSQMKKFYLIYFVEHKCSKGNLRSLYSVILENKSGFALVVFPSMLV